jgi:hypothetical protein
VYLLVRLFEKELSNPIDICTPVFALFVPPVFRVLGLTSLGTAKRSLASELGDTDTS